MAALILVLVASCAAVYTDVRRRRIPNLITVPLLAVGAALQAHHGWPALVESIALFGGVIAIALPLYSLRVVGGGDVKFLAAACAALGWPDALYFLLYALISGGIIAIAVSAARGRFRSTIAGVGAITLPLFAGVRPASPAPGAVMMPYALAFFAGATALAIRNIVVLHLRIFI